MDLFLEQWHQKLSLINHLRDTDSGRHIHLDAMDGHGQHPGAVDLHFLNPKPVRWIRGKWSAEIILSKKKNHQRSTSHPPPLDEDNDFNLWPAPPPPPRRSLFPIVAVTCNDVSISSIDQSRPPPLLNLSLVCISRFGASSPVNPPAS
ncbi:hypothetical protein Droror1_Dr00000951 [Drosera rotundifolia]